MASSGLDPAELIEKALVVENLISLRPSITMSDETLRDKLTIHFQQRKTNRGGDVKYVIYPVNSCCKDVAIVLFEDGKVRESAVQHEQVFLSQLLKVRRFPPVFTSIEAKIDPLFVSIMPHDSASAIPSTLQRITGAHVNPVNRGEISCSHKAQLDHVEREVLQWVFPQKMTVGDHSLVEGATGICVEPSSQQHRSLEEFGAVSKHEEIPNEEKYEESDGPANPTSSSGQIEGPEEFYDAHSDGVDEGLDDDAGVIVDKCKYKYLQAFESQFFQTLSKTYGVGPKFVEKKGDDTRVVFVASNKKAHDINKAIDKFIEFYQKESYDIERKTIDCSSVTPKTIDGAMKKTQDVFKTDTLITKADKSRESCSCIILRRGDVEEVARHFREAAGIKSRRKLRTTTPSSDNNMDTSPAMKATDHQCAKKATRNEPATGPLNTLSTSNNIRKSEGDKTMDPMKFVTNEGMNIMVIEGDITKQEVAAIVNPATSALDNSGGVAKAIVRAAGPGLEKNCNEIMRYRRGQYFQVTECVVTPGFNLKSLIIHAVGPFSGVYFDSELHRTFFNCLREANLRNLPSLAIPLIGAGYRGAYKKVCSDALVGALLQFSYESGGQRFVRDVLLVNIDKESTTKIQCSLQTALAAPNNSACLASGSTNMGSGISQPTSGEGQRPRVASSGQPMLHGNQQATLYDSPKASTESRGQDRENPTSSGLQTRSQYVGKDINNWPTPSESKEHIKNQKHPTSCKAEDEEAHKNRRALHESNSADKAVVSTRDQSSPRDARPQAQATEEKNDKCPICFEDKMIEEVVLQCKHRFCKACIDRALESSYRCPVCKAACRQPKGNQPKGTMRWTFEKYLRLPGYDKEGVITINYEIPGGIQSDDHPNPGKLFRGAMRTAYLPGNQEGRELLYLLKKAFDARLIFTVGRSVTTGLDDTVTWNDIHHKTCMSGGSQNYGYPDPDYLKRVKEDLAAMGIQ